MPGGAVEPVPIAEMTASGFRVARVPPLMGRPLVEEDERPGAPAVVVVGHEAWRTHFQSDPGVVGRTISINGSPFQVVGAFGLVPHFLLYQLDLEQEAFLGARVLLRGLVQLLLHGLAQAG